jgi:hypothetical protein
VRKEKRQRPTRRSPGASVVEQADPTGLRAARETVSGFLSFFSSFFFSLFTCFQTIPNKIFQAKSK